MDGGNFCSKENKKMGGEYKRFIEQFWKDWFEREKKLKSEQMCMHNHSDEHKWKTLKETEKPTSTEICENCLVIREKI
jgi:hypothetical protein|tara:strand:+ start:201 stop:434 length:234 start_codon:yes stop_codon:yes gene_type:complete